MYTKNKSPAFKLPHPSQHPKDILVNTEESEKGKRGVIPVKKHKEMDVCLESTSKTDFKDLFLWDLGKIHTLFHRPHDTVFI
jgi:hypothetical protein